MIPSNGTLTTLLIPLIKAFTIDLNESTIPSLIPSNTFPPVEKTFLTAFHALLNVFLKNVATVENTVLTPFHPFSAPAIKIFHTPLNNDDIVSTTP